MAKVVAAMALSHAPLALGEPSAPPQEMAQRVFQAADMLGRRMDAAAPDVVIAFLDDHFENHFRQLMPTVAVGVAATHVSPATQWLEALRLTQQQHIPGAPEYAERLLRGLVKGGFDAARMGSIEYGNNLAVPWTQMALTIAPAIIPVYINVFSPPLMPYVRALKLGEKIRDIVEQWDAALRVAFLATGGLSHWPPVWTDTSPEDDTFLQRMKRYQTYGKSVLNSDPGLMSDLARYEIEMAAKNEWPINSAHPLVNAEWDREVLKAMATNDRDFIHRLDYDVVEQVAGHGGHEILNWIALAGTVRGARAHFHAYEPVIEWICGMAYLDYEIAPVAI